MFYSKYDASVIVIDGSKDELTSPVINEGNIKYYHMPVSSAIRKKFALSKVKTPYVAFVPDDDFMLPSANAACVDYLNEMPDYVACSGRAMFYEEHAGGVLYREAFPGYRNKDYYQSSAKERLIKFFGSYDVFSFWSVARTSAMRKAVELAYDESALELLLQEATLEFSICAQGKTKVLNHLRWIRSRCPQVEWRQGVSQSQNFYGDSDSQGSRSEYESKLFQLLLKQLPSLVGMSPSDVLGIYKLLNDDAGRTGWFGDVCAKQSLAFRLKQSIKDFLSYLSCPNFFERSNNKQFSEMRSQLVTINSSELGHVKKLLSEYPVYYEVQ